MVPLAVTARVSPALTLIPVAVQTVAPSTDTVVGPLLAAEASCQCDAAAKTKTRSSSARMMSAQLRNGRNLKKPEGVLGAATRPSPLLPPAHLLAHAERWVTHQN
jgi:hypothetical protein